MTDPEAVGRANAPKGAAILERLIAALHTSQPFHRRHRIEEGIINLGARVDAGREVTGEEAEYFELLLADGGQLSTTGTAFEVGVPFRDYALIDAVNHSRLEPFKRTPAHAREAMLHPSAGTPELALGHAFHEYILEPAEYALNYVVPPKVDRRTKVGKATWSQWEKDNVGRTLITADEGDQYSRMKAALFAHPTAAELLTGKGHNEVTIIWPDPVTGLPCKGRIDRVASFGGYAWIVDLKTTKDAAEKNFKWDAARFGYFRAMAWYRQGLSIVKPGPARRCAFVCVEKDPPYCVAVHEAEDRALEQGLREMESFMKTYAECLESQRWPGYDPGLGLIDYPPGQVDAL